MSRPSSRFLKFCPLAILLVAGCGDGPTAPSDPAWVISDGAHAGNERFYFLPSMVPAPDPSGTFDGSLSPEVQVCAWDGTSCTAMLALFNSAAGYGSETVRVSEADEHYVVNWHTGEILDAHPLGAGEVYRVRVLVDGVELGFADLAVGRSGRDLRNVNTNEFVPLKQGRTLAIKFRIEEGALDGVAQDLPPTGLATSAGRWHSCAVDAEGQAWCWGVNWNGELGRGTADGTYDTPQLVTGGLAWVDVEAANNHSCGLATDQRIYCWGSNSFGQLGIGTSDWDPHPAPEPVAGGLAFRSLASLGSGDSFSACGVTTTGDMYCWGLNFLGELGTGAITFSEPTPRLVAGGHSFAGPAGLARHTTCGLETGGDVLCWGLDDFGQLGRGAGPTAPQPAPAPVVGGHAFETVTVGATAACGIDADGDAWCWGRNDQGELGTGAAGGVFSSPQLVAGGHAFAQLSAGWTFACGVDTDGAALCWGQDMFGQLGRGVTGMTVVPAPGPVVGGHVFRSVEAGYQHACGIATDGGTWCWGAGDSGQLGSGSTVTTPTPVLAMDLDPSS